VVEIGLAHRQRRAAQILAVERQDVEGIELHFVVMLARVQRVEIGNAIDPEHHRLAVDHELLDPVFLGGLDDPQISSGPVAAATGDQPHPHPVALKTEAVAVIFHFMQPIRAGRNAGRSCGEAEVEGAWHGAKIGAAPEKYQFSTNTAPARGSAEAASPTEGGLLVG
jgi:hypothetical protein